MTYHSNNEKKKKNNVIVAAAASTVVTLAFFVVIALPGIIITTLIGINQSADAALMDGSVRFTAEPKAPIAISEDGNVYIVWWTNNTENNNEEVMFRASNDAGQTFGDKINLSNTTAADSEGVEIDAEGANVIVTWWERNQTANEHVMRISNDSGQTFGPLLMLSSDGTLGTAASANGGEEEEEEGEGETTISNSSNSSSISDGYDESDATDDVTEPSSSDEEEEEELDPEEEEPSYEEPTPPSDDSDDSSSGNEGTGNNSDSSNSSPPPRPPSPPSSAAAHPISYWLENEEGITQDLLEKAAAERHNNNNNDGNNNNEWSFNLGNFRVPVEFDVSDSENDTKGILELYIEGEEVNNNENNNENNTNAYDQLAAQLLAAKLNIENDVPTCESIKTTMQYADTVLRDALYEGPGSTENPTGESRDYAFELIQILDRYNNNGCV
jgi:hypothetical protein